MKKEIKKRTHRCQAEKEAAVRKFLDGRASASEIAAEYNLGESTLYKWVKKFKNGTLRRVTEIDSDTDDKTARIFLEKKVAELEHENEILKKVLPLFIK